MSEPDRINYTFGTKVNMGNYESVNIQVSLTSDVKKGESREDALTRISLFVETEVEERRDALKGGQEDGDDEFESEFKN